MRRGQRKIWRAVAEAAQAIAESTNYAEEYMAGVEFSNAMDELASTTTNAKRSSPVSGSNTGLEGKP